MEPHVLTCVPAYGYIFHTLEVYLYPTCTAPSQSGVYLELNQATVMESFCKNNTFHQQTHTHTHTHTHAHKHCFEICWYFDKICRQNFLSQYCQ